MTYNIAGESVNNALSPRGGMSDGIILVVDDNEIKRYTTRRTLEAAGFSVTEASTGEEALALIWDETSQPRLVVLDIKLPDINGLEICRRIKADPLTASVLVVHLSAHLTSGRDQAAGLEAGADAYLAVPVDPEVLTATARALLRLSQAEEAARALARHWRETFDAISDAICLLDSQNLVRRSNQAAARLFDRAPEMMPGQSFPYLLNQTFGPEVADALFNSAQPPSHDLEIPMKDGRWFRLNRDPLFHKMGGNQIEVDGTVCVLSDVTTRKVLESQLNSAYAREKRIADVFQQVLLTPATEKTGPRIRSSNALCSCLGGSPDRGRSIRCNTSGGQQNGAVGCRCFRQGFGSGNAYCRSKVCSSGVLMGNRVAFRSVASFE